MVGKKLHRSNSSVPSESDTISTLPTRMTLVVAMVSTSLVQRRTRVKRLLESRRARVECPSEGRMSFLHSRARSAPEGIGKPVRRTEDARLLTGKGCYSDDFTLPGQAYACLVRSPHAHARIRGIDTAPALAAPGVIAVLTGAHAAADGLRPIPHRPVPTNPHEVPLRSRDGSEFFVAPHAPLPADRARFVGEAVAIVLAEARAAARDGAARVAVDYDPLPAVTAIADAAAPGAPLLWEETESNVCVDSVAGDRAAADAAFRHATHVVRLETRVNRVTGVPMEPRAALGVYDATGGRYTLYAGSGGSVRIKSDLASTLGVPEGAVRVVAREVGGHRVPAASLSARAVLSNTSPTYPYRAAGRPEVLFVMERLIDLAARRHGFDRVELRRRNLVPARAMPYRNPLGLLYDSGDYAAAQDRAVALADWAGFEARRGEARRRGR